MGRSTALAFGTCCPNRSSGHLVLAIALRETMVKRIRRIRLRLFSLCANQWTGFRCSTQLSQLLNQPAFRHVPVPCFFINIQWRAIFLQDACGGYAFPESAPLPERSTGSQNGLICPAWM